MQRYLWLALALTSCAKSSKEAGPASTGAGEGNASQAPAPTAPAATATPTPAPGSGNEALEHARAGASLGVSAETDAFDETTGDGGQLNQRRKGEEKEKAIADPKGGGGGGGPIKAAVQATIGAVTVGGKPAADPLVQAVKVRVSDVQACYDKAGKPELSGALEITFTVLPTGALADAKVKSTTLKNMAIESCVVGVIQGIKVAKGAAETKASVAITFAK